MADLLLSYALRPYPGLTDRHGEPVTDEHVHAEMLDILDDVRAAGHDIGEIDPDADFEDFWEDAIRIATVHRASVAAGLSTQTKPYRHDWTDDELARRLGPVGHYETGNHAVDPLEQHEFATDPDFAGRATVATMYTSPEELEPIDAEDLAYDQELPPAYAQDTIAQLRRLYWLGHERAVVKVAGTKAGITSIELSDDAEALREQIFSGDFGWIMLRVEGTPGALRVSPWIPMQYEYRMFVVDGKVVTGAGCIEEFTPLDHDRADGPFDPQVRRTRGNGVAADEDSSIVRRPGLVQNYLIHAQRLAYWLPQGNDTVVIDLAVVEGREDPVVVELNGLPNAGLYACDAQALTNALVTAECKGYWADRFLKDLKLHDKKEI